MMKEIGSIFTLSELNKSVNETNIIKREGEIYLSLAREALLYIAKILKDDSCSVMIPSYTCQTVISPFQQEGWDCYFYDIDKQLRIKRESFNEILSKVKPKVILFHPYYGCGLTQEEIELLIEAKKNGAIIVEDMTQEIFSKRNKPFVDFYLGSLRKWFEIPDGAFISSEKYTLLKEDMLLENEDFVTLQKDAMYLRGEYFNNENLNIKQISIRLNKLAVNLISKRNIEIHRMSSFSIQSYAKCNHEENRNIRLNNYNYLLKTLKKTERCLLVNDSLSNIESAPLYFPIYVEGREDVQRQLACNRVYAPVLWPVYDKRVLVSEDVQYIYDHILLIPIDQRYNIADMQKIVEILKQIK